jgi:response regulator RpfG family c-di-GMP phosphodiesterase
MARIIALADTYDAMARTRVYRHAWPHDRIMEVFYQERGRQLDPYLSDKFATLIERSAFKTKTTSRGRWDNGRRHGDGSVSGH